EDVAAEIGQHLGLLARLDALGGDLDAERAADADDGADEPALRRRGGDLGEELPVELQSLGLELEQARDGGVAGAEIIEADVDAELAEVIEVPARDVVDFLEEGGFDQLEGERAGLDLERAQLFDELLVVQAPEGDVDRDRGHGKAGLAPDLELGQRLFEDGLVDGGDEE